MRLRYNKARGGFRNKEGARRGRNFAGKLGERKKKVVRGERTRGRGEEEERGLRLAAAGAPPCNMSNDSNGVGVLQPLWNLNGEYTAQLLPINGHRRCC